MESEVEELRGFRPAELCNLDYSPARGSAIDPHMDDDWIWGERLVTLNLLSPTYLTFYDNVNSVKSSPSHSGTPTTKVLTFSTLQLYYSEFGHAVKCGRNFACARNPFENLGYAPTKFNYWLTIVQVCVPLPQRSLVIVQGSSRYQWQHSIHREHICSRRLATTLRELTADFLPRGRFYETAGKDILETASNYRGSPVNLIKLHHWWWRNVWVTLWRDIKTWCYT